MATAENINQTGKISPDAQRMGGPSFAPYLEKIAFPQSRAAIIRLAEENNADPAIISRLRDIPDSAFNSIEAVRNALDEEYENYGMVKKNPEHAIRANPPDKR